MQSFSVKLGFSRPHSNTQGINSQFFQVWDVSPFANTSVDLFHLPTLMHNSFIINSMYVTLQSSICFEHLHANLQEDKLYYHSIWYRHSL